ncbi:MAG: hypothetical protein ACO3LF_07760 [Candidatus Kariarchaeum pelagius]
MESSTHKTLILAIPRTGSSRLNMVLGKFHEISFHEPFNELTEANISNKKIYPDLILDNKNLLIKQLISQVPSNIEHIHQIDFNTEMASMFNNVILLDRRDFDSHWNSIVNLLKKIHQKVEFNKKNGDYIFKYQKQFDVQQPWVLDELTNKDYSRALEVGADKTLEIEKLNLQIISKNLNIPITYYEDLFGDDRELSKSIIESWDLNFDVDYINEKLHPKFKGFRGKNRQIL